MGRSTLGSRGEMPGSGSYWVKSSLSFSNGNCVEVANLPMAGSAFAIVRTPQDRFSGLHRTNGMRFSEAYKTGNSTVSARTDRTGDRHHSLNVGSRPCSAGARTAEDVGSPRSAGGRRQAVS